MPSESVFTLLGFGIFGLIVLSILSHYTQRSKIFPDIIWVLLLGVGYGCLGHYSDLNLPKLTLSPDLVLYAFVPLLIFSSTQKMCLFHFRKVLVPASLVGSIGILISMIIIGSTLHYGFRMQWLEALLFGVIISATDPLAVGALLHGNKDVSDLQKHLIEGESILNDGFVVTLAGILALLLFGEDDFDFLTSSGSFFTHIFGALILGVVLGRGARILLRIWKEERSPLTINMTLAIAYGSFAFAEILHLSGILAVFAAALAYGYKPDTNTRNPHIHREIWDYFEYIANTVLFFLLGASFFVYASFEEVSLLLVVVVLILLVVSRFVALAMLFPLIQIEKKKLSLLDFLLLNFSGARGAVSIALILLLPQNFELKSLFLSLAFVMILFSLIIYPLAIKWILEKSKKNVTEVR